MQFEEIRGVEHWLVEKSGFESTKLVILNIPCTLVIKCIL